jgi:type IX secretion system PorP/SprF family membrane protein
MKKCVNILLFSILCFGVKAQQKPYYTQYLLNNYILNPAFAGMESYTDVKFSYRNQWTKIEGAPVTSYLTVQQPLGKENASNEATQMQVESKNPVVRFRDVYNTPYAHHGLGFSLVSDRAGYINRISMGLTYAFHKPISNTFTLAGGFTAGFTHVNVDRSKVEWGALDPNDPALGYGSGELTKFMPELGAGILLYDNKFFFGASVLNMIPSKLKFVKSSNYGSYFEPHFFMQAGYSVMVNNSIAFVPSVAVQYIKPIAPFIHVNAKLNYEDLIWAGIGYRIKDELSGIAAIAGVSVSKSVKISYAYNASSSTRLNTYAGNTHELLIGVTIGKKPEECPTNIW